LQEELDDIKAGYANDQSWNTRVPIKAKVLLNPLKLYSLFGKVPLTFLLHILVILVDGWYLLTPATATNNFMRPARMFLYTKFVKDDLERNDVVMNTQRTYYNLTEFQSQIKDSLDFYFSLRPETE
jgi:hypothetical protein